MKRILIVAAFLFLGSPLLGQELERFARLDVFHWTPVTLDIEGNPEVIANYEIAAFPQGTVINPTTGTMPVPLARYIVKGDVTQAGGLQFLGLIPSGSVIRICIRAYDLAGNTSEWSDPLDGIIDWIKPMKPDKPTHRQ